MFKWIDGVPKSCLLWNKQYHNFANIINDLQILNHIYIVLLVSLLSFLIFQIAIMKKMKYCFLVFHCNIFT